MRITERLVRHQRIVKVLWIFSISLEIMELSQLRLRNKHITSQIIRKNIYKPHTAIAGSPGSSHSGGIPQS